MIERKQQKQAEPAPPMLCDVCGRRMVAQIAGQMLCIQHYDEVKVNRPDFESIDPIHAELLRRIKAHPEWQPQPHETSKQYQRRMFKLTRPLLTGAVERMKRPLT